MLPSVDNIETSGNSSRHVQISW